MVAGGEAARTVALERALLERAHVLLEALALLEVHAHDTQPREGRGLHGRVDSHMRSRGLPAPPAHLAARSTHQQHAQ